jgi:hypothetical protein
MAHANVLRHPVFYVLPLIIIVTAYMFFKKSSFKDGDLFGGKKAIEASEMKMREKNKNSKPAPVLPPVPSGSFPVSGGHALESAGVPSERMPVPDLRPPVGVVPDHSLSSLMGEDDYFVDALGFVDFGDSCAAWVVSDGVRYPLSDIFDRADIDCSDTRVLSFKLEDGRSLRFFSRGVRRG